MAPRHRFAAICAALIACAIVWAQPASAAVSTRVEGPKATIFQGDVKPVTGTLIDADGGRHTTSQVTALGALVAASRTKGFPLGLMWSDCCGGGWGGLFVTSVDGITPPDTAFWAFKINQRLSRIGLGSALVDSTSRVLVYYTTFDPATFATEPTLGLAAPLHVQTGAALTVTVNQFDEAGTPSPAAGAWVLVNGKPRVRVDETGHATLHLNHDGVFRVKAIKAGTIRSRKLWINASS